MGWPGGVAPEEERALASPVFLDVSQFMKKPFEAKMYFSNVHNVHIVVFINIFLIFRRA